MLESVAARTKRDHWVLGTDGLLYIHNEGNHFSSPQ